VVKSYVVLVGPRVRFPADAPLLEWRYGLLKVHCWSSGLVPSLSFGWILWSYPCLCDRPSQGLLAPSLSHPTPVSLTGVAGRPTTACGYSELHPAQHTSSPRRRGTAGRARQGGARGAAACPREAGCWLAPPPARSQPLSRCSSLIPHLRHQISFSGYSCHSDSNSSRQGPPAQASGARTSCLQTTYRHQPTNINSIYPPHSCLSGQTYWPFRV
jgi:hypothetical protein